MSNIDKTTPPGSLQQGEPETAEATVVDPSTESVKGFIVGYKIMLDSATKYALPLEEAEMEKKLEDEQSWFLKQNEELLKLLNRLHRQEYDEVVQDEELLDWISDFILVLLEYAKLLERRRRNKIRQMKEK